jgi:hypothetical protein
MGGDEKTENRTASGGLFAIGWLFLLHGLADVLTAVYRCHDVNRPLTDVLAAALPRSQLCLLAIWLALGTERLSWRICGLIAGCCFIFIVFSRLLFPGEYGISHQTGWLEEEWLYYFRVSGPGDVLVKSPILLAGVAGPLLIWRACRALRSLRQSGLTLAESGLWRRFQFGFQDIAVWTVTLCLALAALYRTAPYPGWFDELLSHLRKIRRAQHPEALYVASSAALYVLTAFVSLGVVYAKIPLRFRVPLAVGLVIGPAYGFELWLRKLAEHAGATGISPLVFQASAETVTGIVAALIMVGSLLLIRLWQLLRDRAQL